MPGTSPKWPVHGADRLVVYLLGGGFGESQIVLLPDGKCAVVDACGKGDRNLTAKMLDHLGVRRIDLLVVTHSDKDHIAGMTEILDRFNPDQVMSYPFVGAYRSLVACWRRADSKDIKLLDLEAVLKRLTMLEEEDRITYVNWQSPAWPELPAEYSLQPLAPTQPDITASLLDLNKAVAFEESKGYSLSTSTKQMLEDKKKVLGDRPNRLSVAVALEWKGRRVLLAGDVENGPVTEKFSGWKGILAKLRKRGKLHLVSGLDLVKVAHHGSEKAYDEDAWKLHAKPGAATSAVLAPFNKGNNDKPLPKGSVLQQIRSHVGHLGITADAQEAFRKARDNGWADGVGPGVTLHAMPDLGAVLAVVLLDNGGVELHAGSKAGFFHA